MGHQTAAVGAFGSELSVGFPNVDFGDEARGVHDELYVGFFYRMRR